MTDSARRTAAEIVVNLLVNRQYKTLEKMTRSNRLSAEEMQKAIEDYGQALVRIPEVGWEQLDVIKTDGPKPDVYYAEIALWTAEERPSDLWISLHLIDRYGGAYDIRLLDIRVH